ncbi:hypothetical protein JCM33374_g3828 [Metschnikowia sp. JCM 33374]|nr:hypothetical protein JCM33374_g3828 [Metschnikowia sp. JCM 33374]
MSKHLAKDKAVWNRLMFGNCATPVENKEHAMEKTPQQVVEAANAEKSGDYPGYNDKSIPFKSSPKTVFQKYGTLLKGLCLMAVAAFFLVHLGPDYPKSFCAKHPLSVPATMAKYGGFVDDGVAHDLEAEPKEIIEVSFPFVPKWRYGKPVYSQSLIDQKFDSWGHPASQTFSPPSGIRFNKVVLTLNTSVSGVQYDRLAHLYVDGAEIWRTSTIEPGHRPVFSSFKKDVSQYINLFHSNAEILFQLDNLVSGKLDGVFHVQLQADFYLSEYEPGHDPEHGDEPEHGHKPAHNSSVRAPYSAKGNATYLDEQYKYYDIRKSADRIYPLIKDASAISTPIRHLPYQDFSVALPKVSHNTTRLKLSIFASGNAQEEFWYNNVLDRFTHRFEKDGTTFHGHGPLRFVNVWIDGKKIATQTPQPFIFTGGFSPSLWSAVVPVNAFDLPSIDLDVSGLLPLLWDSKHHELKISVDNGLDEVDGTNSGIGNDWIISANLLTYENQDIASSSGRIVSIDDKKDTNSVGISLPYTSSLQQIVEGTFEAEITTNLLFELKNGELLNSTLTSTSKGGISNVQLYSKSGRSAKVVHVGKSSKYFSVLDNSEDKLIHETEVSYEYPLTFIGTETIVQDGSDLDLMLVNGKQTTLKINEKTVMDERNFQNGTSTFHLRESGNYGNGDLDTDFKSVVSGPANQFVYTRYVKASDGNITSDENTFKRGKKEDRDQPRKYHEATY